MDHRGEEEVLSSYLWYCIVLFYYALLQTHMVAFAFPSAGRLRYLVTLMSIIDLASILPYFVSLGLDNSSPEHLKFGSALRTLRVLRLLKADAYTNAFESIARVIYRNRAVLLVAGCAAITLLLIIATILYLLWRDHDPENFGSVQKTLFLATLMLTGTCACKLHAVCIDCFGL